MKNLVAGLILTAAICMGRPALPHKQMSQSFPASGPGSWMRQGRPMSGFARWHRRQTTSHQSPSAKPHGFAPQYAASQPYILQMGVQQCKELTIKADWHSDSGD
ncbi:hypothetical protein [Comamonas thiooxydans]|uniref:hypothetical protein n=1 Tax=Comamonas thiooxydans TaxID=363952 RepID=UPI001E4D91DF|nr:hypothetical protein [Comamonas thiooxydans]